MTPADRVAATDFPILDVLAERWSTRVFDAEKPIDERALASALEAARWSPSARNTQPWRFVIARRGTEVHASILDSLMGFNREWAGDAAAFVVALAETVDSDGVALSHALYDTGQAVAHFTVQAHAEGLATHQMGGFQPAELAASLNLPATVTPIAVIAVGAFGRLADASESIRQREAAPRARRPIAESILINS